MHATTDTDHKDVFGRRHFSFFWAGFATSRLTFRTGSRMDTPG
jgi:hypothetical protein